MGEAEVVDTKFSAGAVIYKDAERLASFGIEDDLKPEAMILDSIVVINVGMVSGDDKAEGCVDDVGRVTALDDEQPGALAKLLGALSDQCPKIGVEVGVFEYAKHRSAVGE